jgi:hypothetical protein
MGEKHGQQQESETGREMPAFVLRPFADQLDAPLQLSQSLLESARRHFAVEPFTHCHTDAGDGDYGKDGYISCREQRQMRPAQQ